MGRTTSRWFSRTRGLGGEIKQELSWGWNRKESRTRQKQFLDEALLSETGKTRWENGSLGAKGSDVSVGHPG